MYTEIGLTRQSEGGHTHIGMSVILDIMCQTGALFNPMKVAHRICAYFNLYPTKWIQSEESCQGVCVAHKNVFIALQA